MTESGGQARIRFLAILCLCFLPWLWFQAHVAIPGDMAWLSMAAEKFLAGQRMTEAFHDNNPPLCYLVYIPVSLLVAAGLPIWVAGFVYALGLLAVFSVLLAIILRRGLDLDAATSCAVMAGYLIPLTVMMQPEFGNKDHLIAAALLPFLMAQLCMDKDLPRGVIWTTLILGAIFILMKPHYGLMPTAVIAYRFFSGRGFKVMRDADFIVLATGTVLYIAVVMLWFGDFLRDILFSVSIDIYAGLILDHVVSATAGMILLSGCLSVLAFCADCQRTAERRVFIALSLLSLISAIPFAVQMKGFSLHMIPTLALMFPAIMLALVVYWGRNTLQKAALTGVMIGIGYLWMVAHPAATHEDIQNADLTRYVAHHAENGSFLMQDVTTNIISRISVYTGIPHASRFSNMWFVPLLADGRRPALAENFAQMMAEDIERYKPDFIALYHEPHPGDDPLVVFAGNAALHQAIAAYTPVTGPDGLQPIRPEQFYKRKNVLRPSYETYAIYKRRED